MKRIISLLVVFSIILGSFNISFADNEIVISGLYPIKGDKIRLMSFESNLDFNTFIQEEDYIIKNESDKAQNIEIGLNKDNGIRLPKVKVAEQEIQLREEKDKYSFNIDLDKGEYKKVELSYEVRVNNAESDCIKYNFDVLEKWHKDIIEVKMIFDLQEYIYPEVSVQSYPMINKYDEFNRIVIQDSNVFKNGYIFVDINNKWKNTTQIQEIRELGKRGEYIEALEKALNECNNKEDYQVANSFYTYMIYFAAEYYISDEYDENYPKNQIEDVLDKKLERYSVGDNILYTVNNLSNYKKEEKPLKGKVILLNIEKQPKEAYVDYFERDREEEIKAEYREKLDKLTNEVEELAPNSNIYVPKLDVEDVVPSPGNDEYRTWNSYDSNRNVGYELKYELESLGATVIVASYDEDEVLLSNRERIEIANENEVHMVISIDTDSDENFGNYIEYPAATYIKNEKLYSMCNKLVKYFDQALIESESEYTSKRAEKQSVENKTIFNWSQYPIVGMNIVGKNYGNIYDVKKVVSEKIIEFFNDKDVQAYYINHPRELEKKELELVKEKLKVGEKITEDEVINEVKLENTMKNNSVLIIIGASIAATAIAAILTFVVIKIIKRLRRKKNEQKESNSDSK